MTDHEELLDVLDRLQDALELVTSRGLLMAGPTDLTRLSSLRDELSQLGAPFLSSLVDRAVRSIQDGLRTAPGDLLHLQAALRVFERLLSRHAAADLLHAIPPGNAPTASGTEGRDDP